MNRHDEPQNSLTRLGTAALAGTLAFGTARAAGTVTVFAAASLKKALDAVSAGLDGRRRRRRQSSPMPQVRRLRKQIEAGRAGRHLHLRRHGLDEQAVQQKLIRGTVGGQAARQPHRAGGAGRTRRPKSPSTQGFDLAGLLGEGKLAMADVKVGAGRQVWQGCAASRSASGPPSKAGSRMAENVRAALKLVATGEAALGIVYATDARAEPGVTVLGTFPAGSHPEIVYPVGHCCSVRQCRRRGFRRLPAGRKGAGHLQAAGLYRARCQPLH